MKKISITLLIVSFMLTAGLANAGRKTIGDTQLGADLGSTIFGGGVYKTSTGVTLDVTTDAGGAAYCSSAQHKSALTSNNGLQFATLSSSPAMPSAAATATGKPTQCASEIALPTGFPTQ